ncbi:MAG: family 10 glycosylhydrolase, partial [Ignavibacteria bacterium]|nr:family 10 glycosylhydrolase [Ignavibacteria bacterium]
MRYFYFSVLFLLNISSNQIFSKEKPKLLWFDATANFQRLSYVDSIKYYLDKAKEIGFTDVVVDVKPITGEVLYPSNIAPQMKEWQGFTRSDSLDFLNTFINEAHKRKLKVHASLNIFCEGHNFHDRG